MLLGLNSHKQTRNKNIYIYQLSKCPQCTCASQKGHWNVQCSPFWLLVQLQRWIKWKPFWRMLFVYLKLCIVYCKYVSQICIRTIRQQRQKTTMDQSYICTFTITNYNVLSLSFMPWFPELFIVNKQINK